MTKEIVLLPLSVEEKTGFDLIKKHLAGHLYTPAGRTKVDQLKPSPFVKQVETLNRQSEQMLNLLREGMVIPLDPLEEITEWLDLSKAEGSMLSGESFTQIRSHARMARLLRLFYERHRNDVPDLWAIADNLNPAEHLEKEIDRTLSAGGEVHDHASHELKSIRRRLTRQKQSLRNEIQNIFRKATADKIASDEGPTLRNGRMVIPVQAEHKRKMNGFIHDVSASGQTVYLEPVEALQINNDIRQLEAEEKREIERILRHLTDLVKQHRELLLSNNHWMGELDVIHARAKLGISWEGVLPRIPTRRRWRLIGAKNPVLILKYREFSDEENPVVPLNLELTHSEQGLVISGPNAGGKSVALKTIGVISQMFQSGIPIPAHPDTEIPVMSGIFLDMGDEQSIENDLSTFSSRLAWMRKTLQHSNSNSLILIDEAGTGTDPEEGASLFQAFIESILETGATIIVTTHHGALKIFAHENEQLANGAMEFDQETLAPTYRFRKGVPGSSYAFEIAERMVLPKSVLNRSRELLGEQRDRMAKLLLDLEQKLQQTDETQNQYEILRQKAEQQEEQFRKRSRELEEKRDEKLEQAYREADRVMQEANRKIEQAVEEISSKGKENRDVVRRERQRISDHKKKIRKRLSNTPAKSVPVHEKDLPEIGDQVTISGGDTTGELVAKKGDRAVVLTSGLRIKTSYKKLVKQTGGGKNRPKSERWKSTGYTTTVSEDPVRPVLDLRGMRGEEAVRELTRYLDRVITSGLHEVQIIHGKGEGVLQRLVHEQLAKRDEVRDFEFAAWERGGTGCTEVYLA